MKRVLITGAGSYIGTSFEKWLDQEQFRGQYQVDTLDMQRPEWKNYSFAGYDVVFHVAGIAHADIEKVSEETKNLYYEVNTNLTVETAKKAQNEGVRQFIFMSSIIVYGESAPVGRRKHITKDTVTDPAGFYGDSKRRADEGIQALNETGFRIVSLRPPMVYGTGCKGNYPVLGKLALKLPVFPDINNQRSMIYIGNLCSFIKRCIDEERCGIFFPQNSEYVSTSQLVKSIAEAHEKNIRLTKCLNPFVKVCAHIPGKIGRLVNKAFGNLTYEKIDLVNDYSFEESVRLTETV